MPSRRTKAPASLPPRLPEITIQGSGNKMRHLKPGMEVKIQGETGDFLIKWIDEDGTLACYGGRKGHEMMRAFRPQRVKKVLRSTRAQREALDAASE